MDTVDVTYVTLDLNGDVMDISNNVHEVDYMEGNPTTWHNLNATSELRKTQSVNPSQTSVQSTGSAFEDDATRETKQNEKIVKKSERAVPLPGLSFDLSLA